MTSSRPSTSPAARNSNEVRSIDRIPARQASWRAFSLARWAASMDLNGARSAARGGRGGSRSRDLQLKRNPALAKIGFFPLAAAPTLGEVAQWTGATLSEGADAGQIVRDVAALDEAGPDDLAFLDNPRYLDDFKATRAAAVLVAPRYAAQAPAGCAVLTTRAALSRDGRSDGAALPAGGPAALDLRRGRCFARRFRPFGGAARGRGDRRPRRGDRARRGDRRGRR